MCRIEVKDRRPALRLNIEYVAEQANKPKAIMKAAGPSTAASKSAAANSKALKQ